MSMSSPSVPVTSASKNGGPAPAPTDALPAELLAILNGGALALMLSIGHRTGLFDRMASLPPATPAAIARHAGLDARYVREWLDALVVGGVVICDPLTKEYHLPPAHAACLTRQAGGDNLASPMQWIAVLGSVEDDIVRCFEKGGGVPYARYGRFHAVMAEESQHTVVSALESDILPLVPRLVADLEAGIEVLDIGCGRGRALLHLAHRFPASRFRGYDLCEDAVDEARRAARRAGLVNATFFLQDAAAMREAERYHLITAFDAIHDQARPETVLAHIHRALRPEGVFLMQEIKAHSHVERNMDHPLGPFLYTISCMHCMSVSLAQGGAGLGACWGREQATRMLGEAGFSHVAMQELAHDLINDYWIARR